MPCKGSLLLLILWVCTITAFAGAPSGGPPAGTADATRGKRTVENVLGTVESVVKTVDTWGPWVLKLATLAKSVFATNRNASSTEMLHKFNQVGQQIGNLEDKISYEPYRVIASVNLMMQDLPDRIRLELRLNDLANMLNRVRFFDQQMKRYTSYVNASQDSGAELERHTLEEFAVTTVSHQSRSVRSLVEEMHEMMAPQGQGQQGLLGLLSNVLNTSNIRSCTAQTSPNQLLYNVYNTVALAELKGFTLMQFSWMVLRLYNKGNFTVEARIMQQRYEERALQKIAALEAATTTAGARYYRCNPAKHVEGETYVQLTGLLQGYVENERNMVSPRSCLKKCAHYAEVPNVSGCINEIEFCTNNQRCMGKLYDCQYYHKDMSVCMAGKESHRRYEWIQLGNGNRLGQNTWCNGGTTEAHSWKFMLVFQECSYCFCLCEEEGPHSDRYFNAREVTSNTAENMVVTGVRWVKKNRVVHLQIQEGKLLAYGGVDKGTLRWLPVDAYGLMDPGVMEGEHYHTVRENERAIDLDAPRVPTGQVVTGVQIVRNYDGHLKLWVRATSFNYTAGSLAQYQGRDSWHTTVKVPSATRLTLSSPDVPTRDPGPPEPVFAANRYVNFGTSGVEEDASQTTVPFLDAQPTFTDPPTPLSGVGLFHKGTDGYGGFVTPVLLTYDFLTHLRKEEATLG